MLIAGGEDPSCGAADSFSSPRRAGATPTRRAAVTRFTRALIRAADASEGEAESGDVGGGGKERWRGRGWWCSRVLGDRGYGSAKHVRVALRALPSARRQLERRRCGRSSDTHARAHTDALTHARTGRLDLSRISSRLSADGSVSCLAWTRVQLFLHPLPQRWRSELLDSLSLSLRGCSHPFFLFRGHMDARRNS